MLADALLEHGSALGEFVHLQLHPRPNPAQRRRLVALRRGLGVDLTWPLHDLADLRSAVFQAGVLHRVALRRGPWETPDGPTFLPLVREADLRGVGDSAYLPHLTGLEAVRGLTNEEVHVVPVGLRSLGVEGPVDLGRFPDLTSLAVDLEAWPGARRALASRDWDRLELRNGQLGDLMGLLERGVEARVHIGAWWFAVAGRPELEVEPAAGLAPGWLARDLSHTLAQVPLRTFRWIRVVRGKRPAEEEVDRLRRSARGTPLRLPAHWRVSRPRGPVEEG